MIGRLLTLAAAISSSAAPAQTAPKQPTGKWTVDFADHECILARPYGRTTKDTLILAFKKLPMEAGIGVYVFKYGGKRSMNDRKAELDFGGGKPVESGFSAFPLESGLRMIALGVEDGAYNAAVRSGLVHVGVPREMSETFAVPGLGPALKVLDQCALSLGEIWGIPKDQQLRVATPAKWINREGLFSSNDYPAAALKNDASGKTVLRLMVDEAGKPSDCIILKPSGERSLDSRSCGIMTRRAQFEPARDIAGKPMRSVSVTTINWLLFN